MATKLITFRSGDEIESAVGAIKTARPPQIDPPTYNRSLFESLPDALFVISPDGTILDVNSESVRLSGYRRRRLIGSPFKTFFTKPDELERVIEQVLDGGKLTNHQLRVRDKAGKNVPVSFSAATFRDKNGKLKGIIATLRQASGAVPAEREMRRKYLQARRAIRAKDRFLSSMSHELRTPLNAIIGFAGTLMMKLPGPLTPEQEEQLRTIRASADHLLSLLNDVLDFSKINAGKIELNIQDVPCAQILAELLAILRPLALAKGLEFEMHQSDPNLVIHTDRRALMQILINLAGNAIKFTDKGKISLDISCRRQSGQPVTVLCVSDSGIGISSENQAKLFRAFQQMAESRLTRAEGTGLGLHLSRKLAELLGGQVACESRPGIGSKFTLILPRGDIYESQNPDHRR